MVKKKALYQVKLILDYLPKEEYCLIPQEEIDYINDNFEYDENIVIDPKIALEDQNISKEAYKILNEILLKIEKNNLVKKEQNKEEILKYVSKVKKENIDIKVGIENIQLKNIVEGLKKENGKLPKAKELVEEYQELLHNQEKIIKQLQEEKEYLKIQNEQAINMLNKIPNILKNIFIKKETLKYLNSNKND